jgi:hypothetical protein
MADSNPAAAQARFSLFLTPTADVCHLNGEPRFGFKLKILSHEDEVITVCLHKTPLKELNTLEDIALTTDEEGGEVEWDFSIGCWEYDEPFPTDFCFEEFRPRVPYERIFWLDKQDPSTAQGGELDNLEAGKEYKVQVSEVLLGVLGKWRRGRKEDLLAGGLEEKKERWKGRSGNVSVDVSEPFTFKTV